MNQIWKRRLLASVIAIASWTPAVSFGQFGNTGGFGGGGGGIGGQIGGSTGGLGGGLNTGSIGGTGGFGSSSLSDFGATGGVGGTSMFQAPASALGAYSLGQLPFGIESNLRGPVFAQQLYGRSSSSGLTTGRTGLTNQRGLGGAGGLSGLGGFGIAGLGRTNQFGRGGAQNQQNTQSAVRTKFSAASMRAELDQQNLVSAPEITGRVRAIGDGEFAAVTIALAGETAVVTGGGLDEASANKLARLLLLEPGVYSVRFAGN